MSIMKLAVELNSPPSADHRELSSFCHSINLGRKFTLLIMKIIKRNPVTLLIYLSDVSTSILLLPLLYGSDVLCQSAQEHIR